MRLKLLSVLSLIFLSRMLCAQSWVELNPPGNPFNGVIRSIISDASGNVYAAGEFKNANNEYFVAKWNGNEWKELGTGSNALHANYLILSLATDAAGNIYAAGGFTNSSGRYYVAKWNGTTWSEVGTGFGQLNSNGLAYTITVDKAGNIYAAGGFRDTADKEYVSKWDGNTWTKLDSPSSKLNANGIIYSLLTDDVGNVYAAGNFKNASNKYNVAKWNGSSWTELGALNGSDYINVLAKDNSGNIYATGNFRDANQNTYVAKWNGTAWSQLGAGANALNAVDQIKSLLIEPNGDVIAGGGVIDPYFTTASVQKWDGSHWQQLFLVASSVTHDVSVNGLARDAAGNIYAGGAFVNDMHRSYVGKWDGNNFNELGRYGEIMEPNGGITKIAADGFGNVYALGPFGNNNNYVAKWNGLGWVKLLGGPTSFNSGGTIDAITTDTLGNVYVGGRFGHPNGFYYVAKWDGTSWSDLDTPSAPLNAIDPIVSLGTDKYGNIYATGTFSRNGIYNIAKWNGTGWQYMSQSYGMYPSAFAVDSVGAVYFPAPAPVGPDHYTVCKVTSTSSTLIGGSNYLDANRFIDAIAVDKLGNVYAAGSFSNAAGYYYVAKWNGTSWTELGSGVNALNANAPIKSLGVDPAGNVYAAGYFYGASYKCYVAKWNGTSWSEVGTNPNLFIQSAVNPMIVDRLGNIYAGLNKPTEPAGNYFYVAAYEVAPALPQPITTPIAPGYCSSSGAQKVKLLNMPAANRATVHVRLDNTNLSVASDSSFSFTVSALSIGNHVLEIEYANIALKKTTRVNFIVTQAVVPAVDVQTNITTVVNLNDLVILTAVNIVGGGNVPLFTYSRNRQFTSVLQAESNNKSITISPGTLSLGDNWIYLRMRSNDSCVTTQTNIDSIKVIRDAITGFTDVDFPGRVINIYPNPIHQSFTVSGLSATKIYTLRIVNTFGQVIFSREIRNTSDSRVLIPHTAKGLYWISLYDKQHLRIIGTAKVLID